jgi:hypothetical protein
MQRGLCARQCARWQGAPQYSAALQRTQTSVGGEAQPSAQHCGCTGASAMGLASEVEGKGVFGATSTETHMFLYFFS